MPEQQLIIPLEECTRASLSMLLSELEQLARNLHCECRFKVESLCADTRELVAILDGMARRRQAALAHAKAVTAR